LPAEKITVTHEAPGEKANFGMISDWAELAQLYRITTPYVVAFAGGTVHKNIQRLIQAFSAVSDRFSHSLVLIGRLPPRVDLKAIMKEGLGRRVLSTGYVPDSHIYPILSHADLFVSPSLYEGFGIPVLEAQQANVAVACSTAGSLPEVAGEAAVFFDPNSVDAIAQAMFRCLSNDKLRAELCLLGQQNLKRFAWEKTASQTLDIYRKVLNGG
jgi:glycosyltransferase involved in cell wall biosynthesis